MPQSPSSADEAAHDAVVTRPSAARAVMATEPAQAHAKVAQMQQQPLALSSVELFDDSELDIGGESDHHRVPLDAASNSNAGASNHFPFALSLPPDGMSLGLGDDEWLASPIAGHASSSSSSSNAQQHQRLAIPPTPLLATPAPASALRAGGPDGADNRSAGGISPSPSSSSSASALSFVCETPLRRVALPACPDVEASYSKLTAMVHRYVVFEVCSSQSMAASEVNHRNNHAFLPTRTNENTSSRRESMSFNSSCIVPIVLFIVAACSASSFHSSNLFGMHVISHL